MSGSNGLSLGGFGLLRTIGKGTFSNVALCIHKETRIHYAMKVMAQNKHSRNKHLKEIDLLRKLKLCRHPFMLEFESAFQTQYLGGFDMGKLMKYNSELNLESVRFYAACILLALEYLHIKLQISHCTVAIEAYNRILINFCDVKLENIMLDRAGYAKLVDYGSAEIGSSNILMMPGKFLCFWTDFTKLQCRDIWKFSKIIQEMIEKKVHRLETEGGRDNAMDFVKYGISLENSVELNSSHYHRMRSHKFFEPIDWNGLSSRTVLAPSYKSEHILEDSHSLVGLIDEFARGCHESFVPLSNVDEVEWLVE